jgi:hypothetical protein
MSRGLIGFFLQSKYFLGLFGNVFVNNKMNDLKKINDIYVDGTNLKIVICDSLDAPFFDEIALTLAVEEMAVGMFRTFWSVEHHLV